MSSFSVDVDLTNPGQFFACCGLLELAHRLWPGAEGWFESEAGAFRIAGCPTGDADGLQRCVAALREAKLVAETDRGDQTLSPVRVVPKGGNGLTLDWWINQAGKKTELKLWAGNQTSIQILRTLQHAVSRINGTRLDGSLLSMTVPLTGRLGVDPRSAWNALDVGFSPNAQQLEVLTCPGTEFLAAVGLERFRPTMDAAGFTYFVWTVGLTARVARAACAGLVPAGKALGYRFEIVRRGSYRGFDFARRIGGNGT
jgi:CRISPR-associated protein Csx14